MNKVSEAEINSCTRRFLLENNFQFLSTKNNGEKFYYRIDNTFPPLYKQPDCLCFKDNIIVVWEEKVRFNHLFIKQGTKISDIEKIRNLTLHSDWRNNFLSQISEALSIPLTIIQLIGGVNSLKNERSATEYLIPNSIIHLETIIHDQVAHIKLVSCPESVKSLFTTPDCNHLL